MIRKTVLAALALLLAAVSAQGAEACYPEGKRFSQCSWPSGSYFQFKGKNLQGADLKSLTIVSYAAVGGAEQTGAGPVLAGNFSGADLQRADFRYSHIAWANFEGADLQNADFTKVYFLNGGVFSSDPAKNRTNFDGADLRGARFIGVSVDQNMGNAIVFTFKGADLRGAFFQPSGWLLNKGVLTEGVNFTGALMEESTAKALGLKYEPGPMRLVIIK